MTFASSSNKNYDFIFVIRICFEIFIFRYLFDKMSDMKMCMLVKKIYQYFALFKSFVLCDIIIKSKPIFFFGLEVNDASNAFAFVHYMECFVDFIQFVIVSNEFIDL